MLMTVIVSVLGIGAGAAGYHDDEVGICKEWLLHSHGPALLQTPAPLAGDLSIGDTDVLHYDLDIEVIPASEWLGGTSTITVESLVDGLTIFELTLRDHFDINDLQVSGTPVTWNRIDEMYIEIDLDRAYAMGEQFTVFIDYGGYPIAEGFGSIEFTTEGGYPLVFTLSEPWYAHTWWPVKESTTDKAAGDLKLTVPSDLTVAANGSLMAIDDVGGGRSRHHWRTEYKTATYLFAFSAAKYNTFSEDYIYDGGSMPCEFFIFPNDDTTGNRDKWLKSVDMLDTFADIFGLYPFIDEKYGIYHFGFGGGMEHQTMTGQGGFSESLTSHELAHQWWGDMVTCGTWQDIWLNEGFAEYSEALWYEFEPGSSGEDALHDAMDNRRPGSVDGSVYVPADELDLWRIFSSDFSYRKGAWVVHQLRHVIGDDNFFQMLIDYRAAFEYGSAITEDLRQIAENVYGGDLTWFFDEWVYDIGAPAYRYAWQEHVIAGTTYLEMYISQVQSSSYPIYTMPLDVAVSAFDGDSTVVFWNDEEAEHLLMEVDDGVVGAELDPKNWTLHTSNETTAFVQGPPKVVVVSPEPGASVESSGELTIEITFHKDVVADAGDFSILGDATGAIGFSYAYDAVEHKATLTPDEAPPADDYTLTVGDSVVDVAAGLSLDGELVDSADPASLPSGEGLPGGDAVIVFSVTGGGLIGDVNGDGVVDVLDLLAVLGAWGPCPGCVEDINGDDVVDVLDLLIILANWS